MNSFVLEQVSCRSKGMSANLTLVVLDACVDPTMDSQRILPSCNKIAPIINIR